MHKEEKTVSRSRNDREDQLQQSNEWLFHYKSINWDSFSIQLNEYSSDRRAQKTKNRNSKRTETHWIDNKKHWLQIIVILISWSLSEIRRYRGRRSSSSRIIRWRTRTRTFAKWWQTMRITLNSGQKPCLSSCLHRVVANSSLYRGHLKWDHHHLQCSICVPSYSWV